MDDLNRLKKIGRKAEAGVFSNKLDVENRFASCESTAAVPQASKAKERCTYYADGRWKKRVTYTNNAGTWIATTINRFVWDGKVIMAILNHTNGLLQALGQVIANATGCIVHVSKGWICPDYPKPQDSPIYNSPRAYFWNRRYEDAWSEYLPEN